MAQGTVEQGVSIRLACLAFCISQTCYRYQAKQSAENVAIADHLIRLTNNQRNWGFGLCFLYLRNVKGYRWNHKRVYRIYRDLELNLRIKPRKRIVREKPEPLAVPEAINQCWSMDFMHDQLSDGRSYRLFNVIRSTWAGRPRSVINTGPLAAARFASLVPWLNSRLDMVIIVMPAPLRVYVVVLLHMLCRCNDFRRCASKIQP